MIKQLLKGAAFLSVLLGMTLMSSQATLAQATCRLNGEIVPCDQLADSAKGVIGYAIAGGLLFAIIGIISTVFWIMMIVHAASNQIENKPMWIIIMVLTGVIGALVYYFVVKRQYISPPSSATMPPTPPMKQ